MKNKQGFTLIELVIVVVLLTILTAVALPKYLDVTTDARLASMKTMQGALLSATDLTHAQIELRPDSINPNGRRFTLSNGQQILIRGKYAHGRWSNTFIHLVDFDDVTDALNNCDVETSWCARNRGSGWLETRVYNDEDSAFIAANPDGRGFIIFPNGFNHNNQLCYVYYYSPNTTTTTGSGIKPIAGIVDDDC